MSPSKEAVMATSTPTMREVMVKALHGGTSGAMAMSIQVRIQF